MNQRAIMKTAIMNLILVKLRKIRWISISTETLCRILMIELKIIILLLVYSKIRVKSDTNGNCLFSSLSLTISLEEISPNEISQLICDYKEYNKEFFISMKKEYRISTNTLETWKKIKFGWRYRNRRIFLNI